MNRFRRTLVPSFFLLALCVGAGTAQQYPAPPKQSGRGPFGRHPMSQVDDEKEKNADNSKPTGEQQRQRFLELKKQTAELARLAAELNVAVGESNEHSLSLELAKKADRVEKLSKQVRDRIKHGY